MACPQDQTPGPQVYVPPRPPAPVVPGFELADCLGAGGFAAVYRGVQQSSNRTVACKVAFRDTPDSRTRFHREADALKRIGPPHVPELIADGVLEDGRPYLAMELVPGTAVSVLLAQLPALAPMSWIRDIATGLLECLIAAHQKGVIHRDIKPENVLAHGSPPSLKLIDFGLVRGVGFIDPELTRTGHFLGTPEFASPEQLAGKGDVGPPADVYAFGCFLYELLTLRPPFVGLAAEIEHGHLALRPSRPSTVAPCPPALDDIVLACLEKDPAARPVADRALVRSILRALEQDDSSDRSEVTRAPTAPKSAFRTDGMRPIIVLCVFTDASSSVVSECITSQGGLLVRISGNRYVSAFPGSELTDPLLAAHKAATTLMVHHGARSAIHLASLRIRMQKRGRATVYGNAIERPEAWLPQNSWNGTVFSSTTRPAIREGTLLPVPDNPNFFFWDSESEESQTNRSELVGRERELARLADATNRCFTDKIPTLCTIVGEGGLGKSRLAREFYDFLGRQANCTRAILHCKHPASGESNETARDILRLGLQYERERPPADPRTLCINKLGLDVGEASWRTIATSLGWVSGVLGNSLATPTIVSALYEGLVRRASSGPFVLILDDAHWADHTVLEALERCAATLKDVPLLIAFFVHPLLEQNRQATARARNFLRIQLEPLSKDESVQLARTLLRDVHRAPLEALERLASWAGGSPFMMEELVRGLRQQGLIRTQEGTHFCYLVAEELARLPSSPASQWLVERELSAMPAELSDLTRLCAVLGTNVTLGEVQAVQDDLEREGSTSGRVAAATFGLADLAQRRILVATEKGYAFRAPALQEAVYELVDAAAKKRLHQHACRYWRNQSGFPDRLYRTAYHARGAEETSLARHSFLALAVEARSRNSHLQADEYYSAALELMSEEHGINYIDTLLARGGIRRNLSKYEEAQADFKKAKELARQGNHIVHHVEALIAEGAVYDFLEFFDLAQERFDEAERVPAELLPPRIRAQLDNWVGVQLFRKGKWAESAERLAMAVSVAEALGEHGTRMGSLLVLAASRWCNGQKAEAAQIRADILKICEEADDHFHLTVALSNEVEYLTADGQLEQVQTVAERCCKLAVEHGFDTFELFSRRNLIWLHLRHGELAQALSHGEAASNRWQLRHGKDVSPTFNVVYAFALALAGQRDRAEKLLAAETVQDDKLEPSHRLLATALRLHLGQPVETDWNSVIRTTKTMETPTFSPADIFWLKARTLSQSGAILEAQQTLRDAIEAAGDSDPVYAAVLQKELQDLSGKQGPSA